MEETYIKKHIGMLVEYLNLCIVYYIDNNFAGFNRVTEDIDELVEKSDYMSGNIKNGINFYSSIFENTQKLLGSTPKCEYLDVHNIETLKELSSIRENLVSLKKN